MFFLNAFKCFVLDPNSPKYPALSASQKIFNVCFYYLIITFIASGLLLWYPVVLAEKLHLFHPLEEKNTHQSIFTITISAVIIAPIVEESIFRLSLGYYRDNRYFNWLYYLSSVSFGLLHIFTYNFDKSHYLYIPFITMSQIFSGFMFGYIRIIYGFGYGILLHSLFNLLGVIWYVLVGFH